MWFTCVSTLFIICRSVQISASCYFFTTSLQPPASVLDTDIPTHPTAEEIEDAGQTLPCSMMWSVYINSIMGFIMAITICFCIGDLAEIIKTDTGYPFIQFFYNATQSYAATNVMVTILIITLVSCAISQLATASRQIWSFARDKGILFHDWLAFVSASCL